VSFISAALAMLVAISASYWVLLAQPLASRELAVAEPGPVDGRTWARVLGQAEASDAVADVPAQQLSPSAQARPLVPPFRLWGLVSDAHGGGYALLGVGDEMPAAYATGERVQDGWLVAAVYERSVQLKPLHGGTALTLDLPELDGAFAPAVGVSP
jgi:hypothetical protein